MEWLVEGLHYLPAVAFGGLVAWLLRQRTKPPAAAEPARCGHADCDNPWCRRPARDWDEARWREGSWVDRR